MSANNMFDIFYEMREEKKREEKRREEKKRIINRPINNSFLFFTDRKKKNIRLVILPRWSMIFFLRILGKNIWAEKI